MYCSNCGKELPNDALFCSDCGKSFAKTTPVTKKEGRIAGLILGLIGIIAWFIPIIGYGVSIPGIVICAQDLKKGCKDPKTVVGLIFSILCLIASLINSILGVMMNTGQL